MLAIELTTLKSKWLPVISSMFTCFRLVFCINGASHIKHSAVDKFSFRNSLYTITFRPATLCQKKSDTGAFNWIFRNFKEHFHHRTSLMAASLCLIWTLQDFCHLFEILCRSFICFRNWWHCSCKSQCLNCHYIMQCHYFL